MGYILAQDGGLDHRRSGGPLLAGAGRSSWRQGQRYGKTWAGLSDGGRPAGHPGDARPWASKLMDAARGKMTWPAVFGAEQTRLDAEQAIGRAEAALAPFGPSGEFLRTLARETLVRVK